MSQEQPSKKFFRHESSVPIERLVNDAHRSISSLGSSKTYVRIEYRSEEPEPLLLQRLEEAGVPYQTVKIIDPSKRTFSSPEFYVIDLTCCRAEPD